MTASTRPTRPMGPSTAFVITLPEPLLEGVPSAPLRSLGELVRPCPDRELTALLVRLLYQFPGNDGRLVYSRGLGPLCG